MCRNSRGFWGDGNQWGIKLCYKAQLAPEGLAHAFILAESFLDEHPSALILGDNLFFGHDLRGILQSAMSTEYGASILGYHVSNPKDYGVVSYNANGEVTGIIEKPEIDIPEDLVFDEFGRKND